MNFKVGQRVRYQDPDPSSHPIQGQEGIIVLLNWHPEEYARTNGYGQTHWVYFPCCPTDHPTRGWGCWEIYLRPLTDPRADVFLESLKKLGDEPLILTDEELQSVHSS